MANVVTSSRAMEVLLTRQLAGFTGPADLSASIYLMAGLLPRCAALRYYLGTLTYTFFPWARRSDTLGGSTSVLRSFRR